MNENTRNDIIHRLDAGQSLREIARSLRVSRNTVKAIQVRQDRARMGRPEAPKTMRRSRRRCSILHPFRATIEELLARRPNMRIVELHSRLRSAGFSGGYTILRTYVRGLRDERRRGALQALVAPGARAYVAYREMELEMEAIGCRPLYLFSCTLCYSGRRYLRFVMRPDLLATLGAHVLAFDCLGGVAPTIEYARIPCVIDRLSGMELLFNTTLLRFASHYGYRPVAASSESAEFRAADEAFFARFSRDMALAGAYRNLDHANDAASRWLDETGNAILYRGAPPTEAHQQELAWLVPLPVAPWPG